MAGSRVIGQPGLLGRDSLAGRRRPGCSKVREAAAVAVEACADDTRGRRATSVMAKAMKTRACAWMRVSGRLATRTPCLARLAEDAGNRALRGAGGPGFARWHTCGLCEQRYQGLVACALGWACWKTYVVGRRRRCDSGLCNGAAWGRFIQAGHHEAALSVRRTAV